MGARVEHAVILPPPPAAPITPRIPACALTPSLVSYAEMGLRDLGVEPFMGETVRPPRLAVSR